MHRYNLRPRHGTTQSTTSKNKALGVDQSPELSKYAKSGKKATLMTRRKKEAASPEDLPFNETQILKQSYADPSSLPSTQTFPHSIEDGSEMDTLAIALGASMATSIFKVCKKKIDSASVDRLSQICPKVVRGSLAKIFKNKSDCFSKTFEKSFQSTMVALGEIDNESYQNVEEEEKKYAMRNQENIPMYVNRNKDFTCDSGVKDHPSNSITRSGNTIKTTSMLEIKNTKQSCSATKPSAERTTETRFLAQAPSKKIKENELDLKKNETAPKQKDDGINHERGFEKESIDTKREKFVGACTSCLIAGLFIMLISLAYGAYVYSYKRIYEATTSCSVSEANNSWWIWRQIAFYNSRFQTLICWIQVTIPIVFGGFLMLGIVLGLLVLAPTLGHGMGATCMIYFSLAILSGFVGKPSVDTLGGKGGLWLFYWTSLWLVHLISRLFTPYVLVILYGLVRDDQSDRRSNLQSIFPHWIRRIIFYAILLFLPILCGLAPFARFSEWISYFSTFLGS